MYYRLLLQAQHGRRDACLLRQLAAQLGLVEENEREQMMFLFWVLHFFDRTTIDNQLKELTQAPASFDELPEPLSTLMENFRGDSRRYLPRQTFLG